MSELEETKAKPCTSKSEFKQLVILPCPFCGEMPELPDGIGTQYDIECDCGKSKSCVQISDLMTIEERVEDEFIEYRYGEEYINRAKNFTIEEWNKRVSIWLPMDSAPKDGTPLTLKFKNDLSVYGDHESWNGIIFVGRSRGGSMSWGFAAPVGVGGFPDYWLEGWRPISEAI